MTNKVAIEKAVSEVMKVKVPRVVTTKSEVRAHGHLLLRTHMSLVQREIAEMNVRLMRAFAADTPYAVALSDLGHVQRTCLRYRTERAPCKSLTNRAVFADQANRQKVEIAKRMGGGTSSVRSSSIRRNIQRCRRSGDQIQRIRCKRFEG